MNILGISCYEKASAACLLKNGEIVFAQPEERFSRRQNDRRFPIQAINQCVQSSGLSFADIDQVWFYEKPYLKFYRVLLDHLRSYPFRLKDFIKEMSFWLEERLALPMVLEKEISFGRVPFFIKHHLAHAASSFYVSPFESAAILVVDDMGEWSTISVARGEDREIKFISEMQFPNSLGAIYETISRFLGISSQNGSDELIFFASQGKPGLVKRFEEFIIQKEDGSFWLDRRYLKVSDKAKFPHCLIELFGEPRNPDERPCERDFDLAATLQQVVGDIIIKILQKVSQIIKEENLCLAGEMFLNRAINQRIKDNSPFSRVYLNPAYGEMGGALGAALYGYHRGSKQPLEKVNLPIYTGNSFKDQEIERQLKRANLSYKKVEPNDLPLLIANKLNKGRLVGWFQGRSEFGQSTLGNRAILGSPDSISNRDRINRLKKRTSLPIPVVVPAGRTGELFGLDKESPFKLLNLGLKNKNLVLDAAIYPDKTLAVQTLQEKDNPLLYQVGMEFEKLGGPPILLSENLSLAHEPLVDSPDEAIAVFRRSELDDLVLGSCLVEK